MWRKCTSWVQHFIVVSIPGNWGKTKPCCTRAFCGCVEKHLCLLYGVCMLVLHCTACTACGSRWGMVAVISCSCSLTLHSSPLLSIGRISVTARGQETFSLCVHALTMNAGMALSFKVPTFMWSVLSWLKTIEIYYWVKLIIITSLVKWWHNGPL